jgi:hypothetical protein
MLAYRGLLEADVSASRREASRIHDGYEAPKNRRRNVQSIFGDHVSN